MGDGVQCKRIAALFGVEAPNKEVYRKAGPLAKYSFVPSTKQGRLVSSPAGAARVLMLLHMAAKTAEVRAYCADVISRERDAPKRSKGPKGIAPFLGRVAEACGVDLVLPVS